MLMLDRSTHAFTLGHASFFVCLYMPTLCPFCTYIFFSSGIHFVSFFLLASCIRLVNFLMTEFR
ncbi:hypothetical protein AG1IA_04795 [Rhizoctonia solani AG-1 IA]|uniref:Uncharacterized protein n=1 Tax=Thanatephorus cucumeris (strain AG1-IA) TaxID=983506 RepID=L8WSS3_THACA|nr:hypothetical protein AG1IA_04795 [Rhizoctonia solani AG-1 IA]